MKRNRFMSKNGVQYPLIAKYIEKKKKKKNIFFELIDSILWFYRGNQTLSLQ